MMSGFEMTRMILTSCKTHSVQVISSVPQSQKVFFFCFAALAARHGEGGVGVHVQVVPGGGGGWHTHKACGVHGTHRGWGGTARIGSGGHYFRGVVHMQIVQP